MDSCGKIDVANFSDQVEWIDPSGEYRGSGGFPIWKTSAKLETRLTSGGPTTLVNFLVVLGDFSAREARRKKK